MLTDSAATPARPRMFLVSLDGHDRALADPRGTEARRARALFEAYRPLLERLGHCRVVARAASGLPHAAALAESRGFAPVHLSFRAPHETYLHPSVPTAIVTSWGYPNIPARSFGTDTRHDWPRVCRHVDLVVAAGPTASAAFRDAGVACEVVEVPMPAPVPGQVLPTWRPHSRVEIACHHAIIDPPAPTAAAAGATKPIEPAPMRVEPRRGLAGGAWSSARVAYHQFSPRLKPETRRKIARWKVAAATLPWRRPHRLAPALAAAAYRKHVRRWLSDDAARALRSPIRLAARLRRRPQPTQAASEVSGKLLTLSGLVFTCEMDVSERRSNLDDLLTAFLAAFADRPDATLVVRMITTDGLAPHDVHWVRHKIESARIESRGRVVAIHGELDRASEEALLSASTYWVSVDRSDGSPALLRALAAGRPVIAPSSAQGLDPEAVFSVRSHPEPTCWPHDPEGRVETTWGRLVWSDLRDGLIAAADLATDAPGSYAALASTCRACVASEPSEESIASLGDALGRLPQARTKALGWAS